MVFLEIQTLQYFIRNLEDERDKDRSNETYHLKDHIDQTDVSIVDRNLNQYLALLFEMHEGRSMGPLAGIKVIEMKGIGPGPYAGQILADLGAEVIVVERASKPNSIAPPSNSDVNSRGKRSIALDLKNPMGIETLLTFQ